MVVHVYVLFRVSLRCERDVGGRLVEVGSDSINIPHV